MSVPEITTIYLSPSGKGFGTLQTAKGTHIATHMARDAVDIGKHWDRWARGEKVLSASAIVELTMTLKDRRESFCLRTESYWPGSTEMGNLECLMMVQELGYSLAVYWEALSSVPQRLRPPAESPRTNALMLADPQWCWSWNYAELLKTGKNLGLWVWLRHFHIGQHNFEAKVLDNR